jgi:hypothetical protein
MRRLDRFAGPLVFNVLNEDVIRSYDGGREYKTGEERNGSATILRHEADGSLTALAAKPCQIQA